MRWLTEPFQFAFFGRGLLAGAVVGTLCGALGCYVLLRRMAYLGQGLSYGVLGGVAVAAVAGANPYAGATVGTFLSAAVIDRLRRTSGLGADIAIAIVSTTAFAIGVALVSADRTLDVNLDELLYGNVLGVRPGDVAVAAAASLVIGTVLVCLHKPLVFVTHDPDAASAAGVRAGGYELLLTILIAAAVIVSLRVVGVLLVTAALVLPASIARLACRTLGVMLLVSATAGCVMSVIGLYISYHADIASGPAIVLTGTTGLLATGAVQSGRRRLALAAGRRVRASCPLPGG